MQSTPFLLDKISILLDYWKQLLILKSLILLQAWIIIQIMNEYQMTLINYLEVKI